MAAAWLGIFVLRESKGRTVLTIRTVGGKFLHHKLGEASGRVTVSGKPAAVTGAATLTDVVEAWLCSPAGAEKDHRCAIVNVSGPKDHAGNDSGGAFAGTLAPLTSDLIDEQGRVRWSVSQVRPFEK